MLKASCGAAARRASVARNRVSSGGRQLDDGPGPRDRPEDGAEDSKRSWPRLARIILESPSETRKEIWIMQSFVYHARFEPGDESGDRGHFP